VAIVPAYLALIAYSRSRQRGTLILSLAVVIVLVMFCIPALVKERLLYTFNAMPQVGIQPVVIMGVQLDPSSSARWQDWVEAFQYWLVKPFFGYGITGKSFLDGQYINNLVETGGVGFLAFACVIAVLHRSALRVYRTTEDDLVRGLALGFLAGNVGMMVHALTANTFILIRIMEPYWFLAAMVLSSPRTSDREFKASAQSLMSSFAKTPAGAALVQETDRPDLRVRNIHLLLGLKARGAKKGGTDAT
jgi:O-antigen ligase